MTVAYVLFIAITQHLNNDDCPKDKRKDCQKCAILGTTVVHSDMHTYEQFLKLTCKNFAAYHFDICC